jgi:hypothetical protein
MVAFHDIFSVVAFFIFLRETLEASVIIAVLLQCMNRTMPRLKRQGEGACVYMFRIHQYWCKERSGLQRTATCDNAIA